VQRLVEKIVQSKKAVMKQLGTQEGPEKEKVRCGVDSRRTLGKPLVKDNQLHYQLDNNTKMRKQDIELFLDQQN
jgi:hypothetical protein